MNDDMPSGLQPLPDVGGPAQPLLIVRGLSKNFALKKDMLGRPRGMVQAVDHLSFDLMKGETLGLVGESGCGKSTTSRLIMALMAPSAGEIIFDGQIVGSAGLSLKDYRRQVQMVFQDSFASLNPRMTIEDCIAFAPQVHGLPRSQALKTAHEMLNAVGLNPAMFATRFPHQLSGGQRQRVNIARALALRPKLVILDEPVSALDKSVEAQVLNLLVDLKAQYGLSYLFISHDLNVVHYMSDRVMVMYLGRVAEVGDVGAIYEHPAHPYTAALLDSRPSLDPDRPRQHAPLSGDPPNPINPPSGCRFRTRCQHAQEVCVALAPKLTQVVQGQHAACFRHVGASGHSHAPLQAPHNLPAESIASGVLV
ncbi:MAG: oligopeptide/dipeptide ABC transporter ATP-binding protein [Ottowia sp.]|uniref:ABC transporter ATP-binding protein n=1 Tax=Ottowia sp. TaxID=1898956 RepID=UPI003C782255